MKTLKLVLIAMIIASSAYGSMNFEKTAGIVIFCENVKERGVKMIFPNGREVVPTYNMGVPLSLEKSLMEPVIR